MTEKEKKKQIKGKKAITRFDFTTAVKFLLVS